MLPRRIDAEARARELALVLVRRVVLCFAVACFGLMGCGGGGGGSRSSPSPPPAPPHLSFSPTTATVTAQLGAGVSFRVSATFSQEAIDDSDHIEFDDVGGFVDGVRAVGQSQSTRTLDLEVFVRSGLAIGEHRGTLNFYICKDENCRTMMSGSPFVLPYAITIEPIQTPVVQPSPLSITAQTDEAKAATLTVQFSAAVPVAFALGDAAGHFDPEFESLQQGTAYSLQLRTFPMSAPGTYAGTLTLFVCMTTPCTEQNQALSAPITIPYALTVVPETLLQPVPTVSGLPEWETHQGNASHTGHVPVTLNAAQFAPRWNWVASIDANTKLSPVTAGSGKVVVSASGYFNSASIIALNETDGSLAWRHDFGETFAANHPAVWGGRVFVATSGHQATAMWSFDLADGSVESRTNFDSQWEHYLAPTIKDGHVFTNGGYYGGMYSFRGLDGTRRWFSGLQQYDLWTPAVDERYVYAHTGYELAIVDRRNGARVASVPNSAFNWRGYSLNIAPVLPGDGSVVVVDGIYNFSPHANNLIRYDVATRSESWRISGSFVSNPVVAANRIYVLDSTANRLEARDLSTGALSWSWVVPNAEESLPVGNMIVTDNMIFFCTTAATYAIDLNSRTVVWQQPTVGHLALSSNKILYIVAPGRIDAFDLE